MCWGCLSAWAGQQWPELVWAGEDPWLVLTVTRLSSDTNGDTHGDSVLRWCSTHTATHGAPHQISRWIIGQLDNLHWPWQHELPRQWNGEIRVNDFKKTPTTLRHCKRKKNRWFSFSTIEQLLIFYYLLTKSLIFHFLQLYCQFSIRSI